jgi:hypothetical protein
MPCDFGAASAFSAFGAASAGLLSGAGLLRFFFWRSFLFVSRHHLSLFFLAFYFASPDGVARVTAEVKAAAPEPLRKGRGKVGNPRHAWS